MGKAWGEVGACIQWFRGWGRVYGMEGEAELGVICVHMCGVCEAWTSAVANSRWLVLFPLGVGGVY